MKKEEEISDRNFFALLWLESEGLLDKYMHNHENCVDVLEDSWREWFYEKQWASMIHGCVYGFNWRKSKEGNEFWYDKDIEFNQVFSEMTGESK